MHIGTNLGRIWDSGCMEKEVEIASELERNCINHCLVDATPHNLEKLPEPFASDNQFALYVNYLNLAPEFWHIYACPQFSETYEPVHDFNCLMNRVSGERLLLLYNLFDRGLLDKGMVGFNCLYHDRDPNRLQRKKNFDTARIDCKIKDYATQHQILSKSMPLLVNRNPDEAASQSYKTLVVESYNHDSIIAFSEKIFRALQTPRPWILFGSPGSVKILRQYGFDVLDDCVDHSYDSIVNQLSRIHKILDEVATKIDFNIDRYWEASNHNQNLLHSMAAQWPDKLSKLIQSIDS